MFGVQGVLHKLTGLPPPCVVIRSLAEIPR
jgi:hypothetical protein